MMTLADLLSEAKSDFDDRRSRYPTENPFQTAADVAETNTPIANPALLKLVVDNPAELALMEVDAEHFADNGVTAIGVARVAVFTAIREHLEQGIELEDDDDDET